jgi:steroid delta-isomerase-like uncharacterized protein
MSMETAETNLALARDYIEAINRNDLAAVDRAFADDYRFHGDSPNGAQPTPPQAIKDYLAATRRAFSNYTLDIQLAFATEHYVAVRWIASGTHTGAFMGIPPTGQPGQMTGVFLWRVADGKFAEGWSNQDDLSFVRAAGKLA